MRQRMKLGEPVRRRLEHRVAASSMSASGAGRRDGVSDAATARQAGNTMQEVEHVGERRRPPGRRERRSNGKPATQCRNRATASHQLRSRSSTLATGLGAHLVQNFRSSSRLCFLFHYKCSC